MAQAEVELDIKQAIASSSSFGPREIQQIRETLSRDFSQMSRLREGVDELERESELSPAMKVRLGVGSYLLGEYPSAVEALERADGSALALFFLAKSHFALEHFDKAQEAYEKAGKAGYDKGLCTLGQIESLRYAGEFDKAWKMLEEVQGSAAQSAEYYYQKGAMLAVMQGDPTDSIELYEKAIEINPNHVGSLFKLALENDRQGNNEAAKDLYEKSAAQFPPHVGTLMNLGLILEDLGRFDQATQCFERVISVVPDHPRARMYLKDAEASKTMVYNEEDQARTDHLRQIMSRPVTNFELSVRARNCLQRMGINSLGDLVKITEQELLASKNFGETSLLEIKEMMTANGLRLGQSVEQRRQPDMPVDPSQMSPDEQAMMNQPVSDLNLSVRARKAMIRLNISTIGDLMRYSADDLLECKNFGVTSLNEVREKLGVFNLKLRGE
ncbi:DNA-directed RNA polymerase alpha subunit domain [Planctomycetales bacterium 10988]|nr:DNA-directed RNA polymerase alpha subunit domain [Planctomycetales bacterium 10988]